MELKAQLQQLISELAEARHTYDLLVFDELQPNELGAPATVEQINQLTARLGKPLPPSYRAFLELHNGWSDFEGDGKLLAVEDHDSEWVQEKIQYWNDIWDEDSDNPFDHGAIPVLLGESLNHFLVLDPRRTAPNGQLLFVHYDYMQEEKTYDDFVAYLNNRLLILKRLIERETQGVDDGGDEA